MNSLRHYIDLLVEDRRDDILRVIPEQQREEFTQWFNQIKSTPAFGAKQRDRWLLDIYYKSLTDQLTSELLGGYKFISIKKLADDVNKFFSYGYEPISDLSFPINTSIGRIIKQLKNLEDAYHIKTASQKSSDTAPVSLQTGDQVIFELNDRTKWVFTSRAFCPAEARSGRHCGNVEGKTQTDQRILSLRSPSDQVLLTFILLPTGDLGEMKAAGNKKPEPQYHLHIIELLSWDKITGIAGRGYLPDANFSMFDLNESMMKLAEKRLSVDKFTKLITDQIKLNPLDFINAPESIKQNRHFLQLVLMEKPGIQPLLSNKKITLEDWQTSVGHDPDLIIYVPIEYQTQFKATVYTDPEDEDEYDEPEKTNFVETIAKVLKYHDENDDDESKSAILLKSPSAVGKNYDLLAQVTKQYPDTIRQVYMPDPSPMNELLIKFINDNELSISQLNDTTVLNENPQLRKVLKLTQPLVKYLKVADLAVRLDAETFSFIPEVYRTKNISEYAVSNGAGFNFVPEQFQTYELALLAAENTGAVSEIPEKFRTRELYQAAFKHKPHLILYKIPDEYITDDMIEYAIKQQVPFKSFKAHYKTPKNYALAVVEQGFSMNQVPVEIKKQVNNLVDDLENQQSPADIKKRFQQLAGINSR